MTAIKFAVVIVLSAYAGDLLGSAQFTGSTEALISTNSERQ